MGSSPSWREPPLLPLPAIAPLIPHAVGSGPASQAAVLLWVFVVFATVLLVNLLIAQATTAFDLVRSQSQIERRILFAQLVQTYKDRAGAPPPFNLVQVEMLMTDPGTVRTQVWYML